MDVWKLQKSVFQKQKKTHLLKPGESWLSKGILKTYDGKKALL